MFMWSLLVLGDVGEVDGIVTGPISKACWHQAGHMYPGQTELLAERSHTQDYGMMFVASSPFSGWQMRMLLATTHIPLAQVGSHEELGGDGWREG
jgi:4-hydroxythreonine-4-phosphate dehydrogenase